MNGVLGAVGALFVSLLAGGTFEKVLLVVLIVVALIAVVILAWLVLKLLVVLAKGIVRAGTGASARVRARRDRRAAQRDAELPRVRVGWAKGGRPSLRRAIRDARRIGGRTAPWAIVVCGEGAPEIERAIGMTSAAGAEVRLGASERLVLVDASAATERTLRRLVRRMPWRRPFDALLVVAAHGTVAPQAAHRAAIAARAAGVNAALHVVLPGEFGPGAACLVAPGEPRVRDLVPRLEGDLARAWLADEARRGIGELRDDLEGSLRALRDRAPGCLDLAALVAGGGPLPGAIAATAGRTVPDRTGPRAMQGAIAVLVAGIALAAVGVPAAIEDADRLESLVMAAEGQRIGPLAGSLLTPDPARTARVARVAIELSRAGSSTWTRPTGRWVPGASAVRELAAHLLVAYAGLPLGTELERRMVTLLESAGDLETWVDGAVRADRLLAGWNALLAGTGDVELPELFEAAFGRREGGWPHDLVPAFTQTGAAAALLQLGVPDEAKLEAAARAGLEASVNEEARRRYLAGPVLAGARRAADAAATHAERHTALARTRAALKEPDAAWLVEPEDRLRHVEILPVLGRALGLGMVDADWIARAEADLSRARRRAREDALRITGPTLGTVLERNATNARLGLSGAARSWLEVMDRIEAARIGAGPGERGGQVRREPSGPVTLDAERVRRAYGRIGRYEAVEARVPPAVPPALSESTLARARERLAATLAREVRGALVALPDPTGAGVAPAPGRELVGAIATARRIADWLEEHGWSRAARDARGAAGRAVESHLRLGIDAVKALDPIRIDVARPRAESERVRERLARATDSVRELHLRYAAPLLPLVDGAPGEASRRWRTLVRALDAYERGDPRSTLAGLETVLDAFAADPAGTCADPRLPPAPPGYLGRVVRRTRTGLEEACRDRGRRELLAARDRVLATFGEALARSWPYSGDPASPDAPREAVNRYVGALEMAPELAALDARLVPELEHERALWMTDEEGSACIGFRIEWRARPEDDENAHHLISIELEGTSREGDGLAWRYGTPVALRLKLARHSPYRFAGGTEGTSLEHVERFGGSAALLRMLDSLAARGWSVRVPLVDATGGTGELRLSVRVFHPGGTPLELPAFASLGRGFPGRRI